MNGMFESHTTSAKSERYAQGVDILRRYRNTVAAVVAAYVTYSHVSEQGQQNTRNTQEVPYADDNDARFDALLYDLAQMVMHPHYFVF